MKKRVKKILKWFIYALIFSIAFWEIVFHLLGESKLSPKAEYVVRVGKLRNLHNMLASQQEPDLYKLYQEPQGKMPFEFPLKFRFS
jgi:hypothetical protein